VNGQTPPIDYTHLGYDALRSAMLARAQQSLPEWTDFSENDLGVLLIELFAYACDITMYYQTRIAGNLLPATADEPDALVQMLRLIGYELQPPAPATVNLTLQFDAAEPTPILLPSRTQFTVPLASGQQLVFETERDIAIQQAQLTPPDSRNLRSFFPVPVVQGQTVYNELIGTADGTPGQMYQLRQQPVIAESISVIITEPGGDTVWAEVTTFAESTPADRHFVVQRDAQGTATVVFGDGVNGMVPPQNTAATPVTINATYRVGGGPTGNLPAGTVFKSSLSNVRGATNPQAAAGGTPTEDVNRARSLAPRLYRTQERAVTISDYTDLAAWVPGVGKARAVVGTWNQILLSVAPSGQVADPSELLKQDLLAFFESRRMATTTLEILGPQPADIYLSADVQAAPYYLQSDVQVAVENAVSSYLDFDSVDFGQPIYLSKIYDVVQSLPQVMSLNVTEFSRAPAMPGQPAQIASNGLIQLADTELPRPGYRDNPPAGVTPTPIRTTMTGGVAQPGNAS